MIHRQYMGAEKFIIPRKRWRGDEEVESNDLVTPVLANYKFTTQGPENTCEEVV